MHPVEQLLYFSSPSRHVIIPSNPVLALYQLHYAGFGAIPVISASTRSRSARTTAFDSHAYGHYLHHKYFEVNYGDGLVPLDKLVRHMARRLARSRGADERPLREEEGADERGQSGRLKPPSASPLSPRHPPDRIADVIGDQQRAVRSQRHPDGPPE